VPVVRTHVTDWPVLSTVVALVPFIVAHGMRAWYSYETLAEERKGPGKRSALVVFQLRILAIPLVPLLILNGLRWLVLLNDELGRIVEAYLPLMILLLLTTVVVVFGIAPLLVRWIVHARPLRPSHLRERLDAYSRRVGFRPTNILVWNTGGMVSNALFIGITPLLRYVVITDALIEKLDDSQVEAVFAHETGHGRKHHTQLYLIFVASFTVIMMVAQQEMAYALAPVIPGLVGALLMAFYVLGLAMFFLFFGWMSRRFETEADIFAVQTLDRPESFPAALKAVGLHAGVLSRRGGLRHFGIGKRVGLLNRYQSEPEFRDAFDRLLRRCRQTILLLALLGVLTIVMRGPRLMREGHVRYGAMTIRAASATLDAGLANEALDVLWAHMNDPDFGSMARSDVMFSFWVLAKRALQDGDLAAARKTVGRMHADVPAPGPLGVFNRRLLTAILDTLTGKGRPAELEALAVGLRKLHAAMPNLDRDSVYVDFSDIFLLQLALKMPDVQPEDVARLGPTAKLVLKLREATDSSFSERGELEALAREAEEKDGAYRRILFEMITGRKTQREAVRRVFEK
jgi:Zn-dependent protease with chaperone function